MKGERYQNKLDLSSLFNFPFILSLQVKVGVKINHRHGTHLDDIFHFKIVALCPVKPPFLTSWIVVVQLSKK